MRLSRATLSKIKQNLWWAFAYNMVGVPLAAGVLLPSAGIALTPSIAGAMMGISSLAVMGNSLLLQLEGGPPRKDPATNSTKAQQAKGGFADGHAAGRMPGDVKLASSQGS